MALIQRGERISSLFAEPGAAWSPHCQPRILGGPAGRPAHGGSQSGEEGDTREQQELLPHEPPTQAVNRGAAPNSSISWCGGE